MATITQNFELIVIVCVIGIRYLVLAYFVLMYR